MKRGIDTNVIVYAHIPSLPDHVKVRRFLLDQLSDPDVTLVVTPSVLHEFVRVVTDPRRFEPPVAMSEALAVSRGYLGRSNVECLAADESALTLAFDLLEHHGLGRKRVADTLLASTLIVHGVREIITCDPGEFVTFDDLNIVDPRLTG